MPTVNVRNLTSTDPDSLANSWTRLWLGELDTTKGFYSDSNASIDAYGKTADTLAREYQAYEEKFGPMRDQLLELAGVDMGRREQLAEQFMQVARADYEGEAGRAAASVAHQTENARGQLRRTLGPTNRAQYADQMTRLAAEEAKNKVLAATQAKLAEKDRVAGLSTTGIQLFDPVRTTTAATNIESGKNELLLKQAGVLGDVAQMKGSLAASYNRNITEPIGELANTYQGIRVARDLSDNRQTGSRTTTFGGVLNPGSSFSPEAIQASAADHFSPRSSGLSYGTRDDGSFGLL